MKYKKIFFLLTIVAITSPFAFAETQRDLDTEIRELREQIIGLRQKLDLLQGTGLSNTNNSSPTFRFTRKLSLGDENDDVRQLQILLNSDSSTRVAHSGAGSNGNETTFFGILTKKAVIKFQNKYATGILTPVGLSYGTGFVGFSTIAKLNSMNNKSSIVKDNVIKTPLIANDSTALNDKSADTQENFIANSITTANLPEEELFVIFPSEYSGISGADIILYGSGFTKEGNSIYFNKDYKIENVSTTNSNALTFTVPNDLEPNNYKIWVVNEKGKSNTDAFFIVTGTDIPAPVIDSISPKTIKYGEIITIKGSGFVIKENTIRAGYANIENVSSPDGETLNIEVKPPFFADNLSQITNSGAEIEFLVYVVNKAGVSNGVSFKMGI